MPRRRRASHALVPLALFAACLAAPPSLAVAAPALGPPISSRFTTADTCFCHGVMLETWRASMHGKALSDPVYVIKRAEAGAGSKGTANRFCDSCHAPVATMSGELPVAGKQARKLSKQGSEAIACDFCHSVTGAGRSNASLRVLPSGVKRGPVADAKSPLHSSAKSRLHTRSEFCGACHDVRHPANGLMLESTYSEWKASAWAKQGVTCQDCHMVPGAGVKGPVQGLTALFGVERWNVHQMAWAGGNYAVGPKGLSEGMLRTAAELSLSARPWAPPGSEVTVSCEVRNKRAGHDLPTGATELRQMWLHITAFDLDGNKIAQQTQDFGTELGGPDGKPTTATWKADRVLRDDGIPANGSVRVDGAAKMPVEGGARFVAELYYQPLPPDVAAKARLTVAPFRMAETDVTVYANEREAKASMLAAASTASQPPDSFSVLGLMGALLMVMGVSLGGAAWMNRSV